MNNSKIKDAQTRATRTAIQGLVITVLVAALDAANGTLPSNAEGLNWSSVGTHAGYAALVAAGMALASFLHRLTDKE
jgi:hypothetical protein